VLSALVLVLLASCRAATRPGRPADTARPARLFNDLGSYTHPITTRVPLAQRWFDQGLVLAYGFNHDEARLAFLEVAKADPDCAMAWWGVAYTLGPNYNLPGDQERDREAYQAVVNARAATSCASARERAYVEAIAKRYAPDAPADRRALDEAWAAAMGDVAARFPDDLDAATIHAEALMDLQPWDLWTKDGQPKGRALEIVAILESVLARDPQHPGANHLYIHTVEASSTPERGTAAADRLRDSGIQTGHLVHMPSHIYIRTGRFADATEVNVRAVAVDEAYIQKWNVQGVYPMMYYPHNIDFQAFSAAMEGRSAQAIGAARATVAKTPATMVDHMAMLEGFQPRALFALVRFGRWDEVLAEPAPPERLVYASGAWHWARGLAFAAQGKRREAEAEAAALAKLERDVPAEKLVTQVNTGKRLLGIASNHLAGELAARRGRTEEAVQRLRAASALEDELTYMEPPDWWIPVRHSLGAVLLDAGRAREAEAVYREDLQRFPENGWSLLGLALALEKQGKAAAAAETRERFKRAWSRADVEPVRSASR
jgi:tetratricopeptide (TPR) repeat protein